MNIIPVRIKYCLFTIVFIFIGCKTSSGSALDKGETGNPSNNLLYPDLAAEPLPENKMLTQEYFQKAYPNLSADEFTIKWEVASKSPMHLIRSFVNTWYDEAALVANPGPIGPCFGDPHIENFGFLWFDDDKWHYTYNDLDDVGSCPVLFDALRFFTTLSLQLKDPAAEESIRNSYIGFLNGNSLSSFPSQNYLPNHSHVVAKNISSSVADDKLILGPNDRSLSPEDRETIFSAVQKAMAATAPLSCVDIFEFDRAGGGSAGLTRYQLLARGQGGDYILLELKELGTPGTERGPWTKALPLSREEFITQLWGNQIPKYSAFASWGAKSFLIRSLDKKSIDFAKMSADEEIQILTEEAYIMAQMHRKSINGDTGLSSWLAVESKFMVKRYRAAVKNAAGAP